MNIVLCGIKHCGKTTLGRGLARARAVDFRDSDAELERRFEREHNRAATVREIFREIGETEFRRLEAAVLD